jgi:hypothetical protein
MIASASWVRKSELVNRTNRCGSHLLRVLALPAVFAAIFCTSSCTLLTHSPYLSSTSRLLHLQKGQGLLATSGGEVPYQRWRLPQWSNNLTYVWMVGNHDFRKSDSVDMILYFHGMHSKDYYRAFRKELEKLAARRSGRPFLFVGFVDTPFAVPKNRSKYRWKSLVPESGERPERLFKIVNQIYRAFRKRFPNIKRDKTKIVLAGFSGGGRVMSSIGKWLTENADRDPYARVFSSHLSKMVYFDCWFDPADLKSVPALLAGNPSMKIVGTVHMKKPRRHAKILAKKFRMKHRGKKKPMVGMDGRLIIFRGKSHWDAMVSRLEQALDV